MKNKTIVIQERRQRVAALSLMGWFQDDIAREVGCSQQQVSHDLKSIRRSWHASMLRDFDKVKAEELAKLDLIESQSWGSWQKSKEQREITVQETNDGKRRVSRRLEGQAGDPRYLEMVLKCVERRCELLGLNAAKKFHIKWDSLSDTQLERLALGEPVATVLAAPAPSPLAEA